MRENNAYANKTWKYVYDKCGNIVYKDEYAYTTGTLPSTYQDHISYAYSTGAWGDMLTSYNGTTISYDAIGNPTKWRNALGLTWSGKQLTYIAIDGLDEGLGASYNADGIRTKKTYWDENANQTVHDYVLDGSKIVKETVTGSSSYTMYYYYDASGSIAGFEYNGTTYYFQKNLQGDIIRICNIAGNTVVEYTYDAWGKVLSVTGSLASTVGQANPFRYRGYYYDTETGLHYLQTRYYDPVVGRFLNADGYISTGQGIIGNNMFAYCSNNPANRLDSNGQSWTRADISRDMLEGAGGGAVGIGLAIGTAYVAKESIGILARIIGGISDWIRSLSSDISLNTTGVEETTEFVIENVITEAYTDTLEEEGPNITRALYYGGHITGGNFVTVTGGMHFEEAIIWVESTANSHRFGKQHPWGVYTYEKKDALNLAIALGFVNQFVDKRKSGEYLHYHPIPRDSFYSYESFHIWFGELIP